WAPDGAILAMVGGRDYNESQFNRAVQAKRQPGSLFKVFVYLAAFQKGVDPQMTAVDRPVQIGDWAPENYGGRFRGQMTLRSAFAHSINSVAGLGGRGLRNQTPLYTPPQPPGAIAHPARPRPGRRPPPSTPLVWVRPPS